ncbi:uncharacterized protein K444DRAFT_281166 [Hyaloscypha bicolor E]|uniref:Uncharacterized protein n=1 Tax=Hyaloscypha bicolor E TaxID=1095630 RepID=A0A2J6SFZ1_9HELO|nr:uncharacterized protein K444DRAFT_281166 [Hyaloscypha bicolor E]PMD49676.1 hypothetical protein K444DRAFT_281166 [Hyaloscypha bicolor E]
MAIHSQTQQKMERLPIYCCDEPLAPHNFLEYNSNSGEKVDSDFRRFFQYCKQRRDLERIEDMRPLEAMMRSFDFVEKNHIFRVAVYTDSSVKAWTRPGGRRGEVDFSDAQALTVGSDTRTETEATTNQATSTKATSIEGTSNEPSNNEPSNNEAASNTETDYPWTPEKWREDEFDASGSAGGDVGDDEPADEHQVSIRDFLYTQGVGPQQHEYQEIPATAIRSYDPRGFIKWDDRRHRTCCPKHRLRFELSWMGAASNGHSGMRDIARWETRKEGTHYIESRAASPIGPRASEEIVNASGPPEQQDNLDVSEPTRLRRIQIAVRETGMKVKKIWKKATGLAKGKRNTKTKEDDDVIGQGHEGLTNDIDQDQLIDNSSESTTSAEVRMQAQITACVKGEEALIPPNATTAQYYSWDDLSWKELRSGKRHWRSSGPTPWFSQYYDVKFKW